MAKGRTLTERFYWPAIAGMRSPHVEGETAAISALRRPNRTLLLRTRIDTHLRDGEFNQDKTLGLFEAVGKIPKNKGLH